MKVLAETLVILVIWSGVLLCYSFAGFSRSCHNRDQKDCRNRVQNIVSSDIAAVCVVECKGEGEID